MQQAEMQTQSKFDYDGAQDDPSPVGQRRFIFNQDPPLADLNEEQDERRMPAASGFKQSNHEDQRYEDDSESSSSSDEQLSQQNRGLQIR